MCNQKNTGADEISEVDQRVCKTAGRQGRQATEQRGVRSPDKALACLGTVKILLLRIQRKTGWGRVLRISWATELGGQRQYSLCGNRVEKGHSQQLKGTPLFFVFSCSWWGRSKESGWSLLLLSGNELERYKPEEKSQERLYRDWCSQ